MPSQRQFYKLIRYLQQMQLAQKPQPFSNMGKQHRCSFFLQKNYKLIAAFSVFLFFLLLIVSGVVIYILTPKYTNTLVSYSFKDNVTYNYFLYKNTTYIKDGSETQTNTTYFTKIICQNSGPTHFGMLFIVMNFTVTNKQNGYSNQIFPNIQTSNSTSLNLDLDMTNPIIKNYVNQFLCFRFYYNITTQKVYNISFPQTLPFEFKSLIPKFIESFLPLNNRSMYNTGQPINIQRTGMGNVSQLYTSQQQGKIVRLIKQFERNSSKGQKYNSTFNYKEVAQFDGPRLMKNFISSLSQMRNSQSSDPQANNPKDQKFVIGQIVGVGYDSQYILTGINMSLYNKLYGLNKITYINTMEQLRQQIIKRDPQPELNTAGRRRQLLPFGFDITQQGLTLVNYTDQKDILKTNFFGMDLRGGFGYRILIHCKNVSNKYIPKFLAQAFSYLRVDKKEWKIVQYNVTKQSKPISLGKTIQKILNFVIKHKQSFQLAFQVAKVISQGIKSFNQDTAIRSIADVKKQLGQVGTTIARLTSQNGVFDIAMKFKKAVQEFLTIFNQKLKLTVEEKATYLGQLIDKSKQTVQKLKQLGLQQFNKIKLQCKAFSQQIKLSPQFKKLNEIIIKKNKDNSDFIINDQYIANQYKKSQQLLQPVFDFYKAMAQEVQNLFDFNADITQKFLRGVDQIVYQVVNTIWQVKVTTLLQRPIEELDKRNQLILTYKTQAQNLYDSLKKEIVDYLNSLRPPFQRFRQLIDYSSQAFKALNNQVNKGINKVQEVIKFFFEQPREQQGPEKDWINQYMSNDFFSDSISKLAQNGLKVPIDIIQSDSYTASYQGISDIIEQVKNILKFFKDQFKKYTQIQIRMKKVLDRYSRTYFVCNLWLNFACQLGAYDLYTKNSRVKFQQTIGIVRTILSMLKSQSQKYVAFGNQLGVHIKQASGFNQSCYNWINNELQTIKAQQESLTELCTGYTKVKQFYNLNSQDMTNQILMRNLSTQLVKRYRNQLPPAYDQIYSFQGTSIPAHIQKMKQLLDTLEENNFFNKFITKIKQYLQNQVNTKYASFNLPAFTQFQPQIKDSSDSLVNMLNKFQSYAGYFWKQAKVLRQLNNLTDDMLVLFNNQTQVSPFFTSYQEYLSSLNNQILFSGYLLGNFSRKYNQDINTTIQLYTAIQLPQISQARLEQLKVVFGQSFLKYMNFKFKNIFFVGMSAKINSLLIQIKNLDFDLRIIYLAADYQAKYIIPFLEGLLIQFQEKILFAANGFKSISQMDANFKVSTLNQIIQGLKSNSLFFPSQVAVYDTQTKYYLNIHALSKIKKQTILDSKVKMINLYVLSHNYFTRSTESLTSLFQSQFGQFIPIMKDFDLANVNAIFQIVASLQKLPANFIDQMRQQMEFLQVVKQQLDQSNFQGLQTVPENLTSLIDKAQILFSNQVRQSIQDIIKNINNLKKNMPAQFHDDIQEVVSLAESTNGIATKDLQKYFPKVRQLIKTMKDNLKKIDVKFFDVLREAMQQTKVLDTRVSTRINTVSQQCTFIGDTFKNLFTLKEFNLTKIQIIVTKTVDQVISLIQLIASQDQQAAVTIAQLFSAKPAVIAIIRAPFKIIQKVLDVILKFSSKVKDFIKKAAEGFKQKIFNKMDGLKNGQGVAKDMLSKIKQQPDGDGNIVLFQRMTKNLLQNLKFQYQQAFATPVGCIIIGFGIQFAAFLGVRIVLQDFRTIGGQFFVSGYIDIMISFSYGAPKVLQFGIVLTGRIFNTKLTAGLYFQNIVPLTFIAQLRGDQDMQNQGKCGIRFKITLTINTFKFVLKIRLRIAWIQFVDSGKQICIGKCFPIKVPKPVMKQIALPQSILIQGPDIVKVLFQKLLVEWVMW